MKKIVSLVCVCSVVSFANFVRDDVENIVKDVSSSNVMWQDDQSVLDTKKTWEEAIDYCESLSLGGYDDWALPNINELLSIVDFSQSSDFTNPIFRNSQKGHFWSSTSYSRDEAWFVNFSNNNHFVKNKIDKNTSYFVRCIKTTPRFQRDDVNEVVIDNKTNLIWQDDIDAKYMRKPFVTSENYVPPYTNTSGDTAVTYCKEKGNGWRLPNLKELRSILDPSRKPTISRIFKYVQILPSRAYIANEPNEGSKKTKVVNFMTDILSTEWYKDLTYHIRCVKNKN